MARTPITDEKLAKLVAEFVKPRPGLGGKSYLEVRREQFNPRAEKIRPLLETPADLSESDAGKIYRETPVDGLKLHLNDFMGNGLPTIRKALNYLLHGSGSLQNRFCNFAYNPASEYRLKGVSGAFASTVLLIHNPTEYAIWNSMADAGLKKLGLFPDEAKDRGSRYVEIVKIMKDLQQRCHFEDLNIADEFVEQVARGTLVDSEEEIAEFIDGTIERRAGFQSNSQINVAVEQYAMKWARKQLAKLPNLQGEPKDTSSNKPYDFLCKVDGRDLYVEVKGTQTAGDEVLLTPGEVKHAETHRECCALFIVHSAKVKGKKSPVVTGGKQKFLPSWDITKGVLRATGYIYTVPPEE